MIKVGVFFGGSSREREVSFAGGRTVYDNLDKNLFTAIPIFVDPFGNFTELNWEYVYRGTIRDFYPPVSHLPESPNQFQIYADSLNLSRSEQLELLGEVGNVIEPQDLSSIIDMAFLALHGEKGEDGTIQGLLEWYSIPYTGSSILASSLGMNKGMQKVWMENAGFDGPNYYRISSQNWKDQPAIVIAEIHKNIEYPLVVKSANQGSSIGITVIKEKDIDKLTSALDKAFFTMKVSRDEWKEVDQANWMRNFTDIRSNIGFPVFINDTLVLHPEEALKHISSIFQTEDEVILKAQNPEIEVIVEEFINGREFSCIVIRNHDGQALALPPTEIVTNRGFFDYRSKYLPGLSRKVTPIDLPTSEIKRIREDCSRLYTNFGFRVYARIDGFYGDDGKVYLNDPNTTSGMMPSSFFFHQAAEIGLNPSQFLTYLVRTSLIERLDVPSLNSSSQNLLNKFEQSLSAQKSSNQQKVRTAILMGGYSTERHISVESGRNIFEKLSSSLNYSPVPIFLTGNNEQHRLFLLPVNIMLKDNADDIKTKLEQFHQPDSLLSIISEFEELTNYYTSDSPIFEPKEISYSQLHEVCDEVFIALHGRPGEDGAVQQHLDALSIPYNGSGQQSSNLTIDKFQTNKLLRKSGFLVADNYLVEQSKWEHDPESVYTEIESIGYPLIAKPSDEGCSSAVKKIRNLEGLKQYAEATFRTTEKVSKELHLLMDLDDKEEFPRKGYFLVENYIDKLEADYFLEITGGLLTSYVDGKIKYEIFEPSEALAEGEVLSLAEKFLAGEGQNITPARFSSNPKINRSISNQVREVFERVATTLNIEGYCRIDAFVRIFNPDRIEVIIIELNSLPGMTPATCIYHQAAINGYKPFEFIDKILTFGRQRLNGNPQ
jgi:D-alanine-D-alanine ligase/UDP-N-acetylmuramate--alanine ligase